MFRIPKRRGSTPQRAGCHKGAVISPRERIISEKSDLFMLRWLGKQDYTLNMFQSELQYNSDGAQGDGRLGPACPPKANRGIYKTGSILCDEMVSPRHSNHSG